MSAAEPIFISEDSDMDISDAEHDGAQSIPPTTTPSSTPFPPVSRAPSAPAFFGNTDTSNSPPFGVGSWKAGSLQKALNARMRPFVVDPQETVVIDLAELEDPDPEAEDIEDLYGPFATSTAYSPVREGSPMKGPRLAARQQELARQQEITKLKLLIAEKERLRKQKIEKQDQQSRSESSPLASSSASSISQTQQPPQPQPLPSTAMDVSLAPAPLAAAPLTPSAAPSSTELQQSIDAVNKEIDDSKAELAATFENTECDLEMQGFTELDIDSVPPTPAGHMASDAEMDEGEAMECDNASVSSDTSYATARSSLSDADPMDTQMAHLMEAIDRCNEQLEAIQKERREANLRVLGLEVRLSMQKNRKASSVAAKKGRRQQNDYGNSSNSSSSGLLGRRSIMPGASIDKRMLGGRTPPAAAAAATATTTATTRRKEQAISNNNNSNQRRPNDWFRMDLPPPPPAPPPAPPFRSSVLSIQQLKPSSPPPIPAHNRAFDHPPPAPFRERARPAPPSPTKSPPPSGATPIVDGMKLATYLSEVEELVKVRLTHDNKAVDMDHHPQRTAQPPLRMITVDGYTLSFDMVLLRDPQSGNTQQQQHQQQPAAAASPAGDGHDTPKASPIDSPMDTTMTLLDMPAEAFLKRASALLQDLKSKAAPMQDGEKQDAADVSVGAMLILLRTLDRRGLGDTLQLVTDGVTAINEASVAPVALDKLASGIYLDDHDLYVLWMSVVYFYIFGVAPESILRRYAHLADDSRRTPKTKPMFTIPWGPAVADAPLSRSEQIGTANLLLSMVRLFGKKARGNQTKRPLLISVWHTLLGFLAHIECYKNAGTLALLRKGLDVDALAPEIYDMAALLEAQLKGRIPAVKRLQKHTLHMPSTRDKLVLAYRCARSLDPSDASTQAELCEAARLLALPMRDLYDIKKDKALFPFGKRGGGGGGGGGASGGGGDGQGGGGGDDSRGADSAVADEGNVQVDFVRRMYLSALGMDPTPPAPAKPAYHQGRVRHAAFAWINLLFLTQISLWLYPTPALQSTLLQQLRTARNMAIEAVDSDEAKLLILKYCKHQI